MSVSAVQQSDSVKDVYVQLLSFVQLFATLWTVALRAPLSMGFSWQEYWSGLPFPPPGALLDSGIELTFPVPAMQGDSLPTEPPGKLRNLCPLYAFCKLFIPALTCLLW